MDGDARGGAALSIRAVTGLPIKFIGTGEKTDALEPFHPDRFASRILGMGDVLSLIEKAKREHRPGRRPARWRRSCSNKTAGPGRLHRARSSRCKKMGPISNLRRHDPGPGWQSRRS